MTKIKAYSAKSKGERLQAVEVEIGELRSDEVLLKVLSCGLCHSDLSLINDDWQTKLRGGSA